MAVFRIERTKDYTVMSNHHLRNHELSLKAKGLLSMMYPCLMTGTILPVDLRKSARRALMPSAVRCGSWKPPVTSCGTSCGTNKAGSATPSM